MTDNNTASASATLQKVFKNIEKVMKGQSKSIRLLLAGFAGGGHILLEDYPGTGKTTLAKTLALSLETHFTRIQFTPDLLPSDILGVSIFDPKDKDFRLHKGPVFTNILLADEI
ncbi:MAG: magnesium chelatase, partial [Candidatus Electrothrix sp. AR4]|nr:magnesium chelatase [Candidatus Electrothrix sp. AR4]